jgi:hypothetical protein
MDKRIFGVFLLAGALFSSPAFAAQNVANTSQKGSLLIFPLITINPEEAADTLIEISNDETSGVQIECSYINQAKGRVDFDFFLTPKATASWDVLTGFGENVSAPSFPTDVGNPTFSPIHSVDEGELVCFAVDSGVQNQIAFNHLTGTATVVHEDDADADQIRQAFRYNAWAFIARAASGGAADNTIQGTPGDLQLTGGGAGTYDACPAYNVGNFMPNGATLGPVTTIDNDLWAVSCNQDLRQDYLLNRTKLLFTVWNSNENSFTGSYQCSDSVTYAGFSADDNVNLVNPNNFASSILRTRNARFQVRGVASSQCPGSQASGLLGVLTSSTGINDLTLEDAELGSNTQGAGAESGFVLWDAASGVPQIRQHRR